MNFGILIFPQVEELDFIGPWEMLALWSKIAGGPENCLLVAETLSPVICAKGLSVNPFVSIQDCPPLDFLLVPGGQGTRTEVNNQSLLEFVAAQALNCQTILSVCTGAFVLHAAGLLAGKRATTHWGSLDRLRALSNVQVVEERFVHDGNIWTSAGISAGMDMMLAFIEHFSGAAAAGKVQFASEYYPSQVKYGGFENHAQAPAYIKI
jgi:transcriptional regulator GlxA family with amidase domain